MRFNIKSKRFGFTLAEIVIALFIISIVTMLSVPIIKRQISKVDEYAYYMAFKSLQDMASQIAIWGDEEESPLYTSLLPEKHYTDKINDNKLALLWNGITEKLVGSEKLIFTKLSPKAVASGVYTHDNCSSAKGFYNKINSAVGEDGTADFIECTCKEDYVESINNEKVCCPYVAGKQPYSYRDTSVSDSTDSNAYACVSCQTDFNPTSLECCPNNSVYDAVEQKCKCLPMYEDNGSGSCVVSECPKGYTLDESSKSCFKNPPILKAEKFCKLIYNNWNVAADTDIDECENFTEIDSKGIYYNEDVYNAILGAGENNTSDKEGEVLVNSTQTILSNDSKIGAFEGLTPHIVLANGIKLWILGDKSASIVGLSDIPELPTGIDFGINHTRNLCVNLKKTTEDSCASAGGYFCSTGDENNCYGFYNDEIANRMGDARGCCTIPDFADIKSNATADKPYNKDVRYLAISGFTVLADVNGDRGSSTLWEDVYPFFISSNGKVYPGYPLDAARAVNVTDAYDSFGGDNPNLLPTDVYYYATNDDGTARRKYVAFSSVSYARALCSAREVPANTPYCKNLNPKFVGGKFKYTKPDGTVGEQSIGAGNSYIMTSGSNNPCDHYKCFVSLRRKLKMF